MPVKPTGKHKPWDRGHRSRLSGAAPRDFAAAGMGRPPDLLSRFESKGRYSSAYLVVVQKCDLRVEYVWYGDGLTFRRPRVLHHLLCKLGEVKPVVLPRKVGRPIIAYPSRLTNTPYDCFAPAQVLIVFADLEARRQVDAQPLMDAFALRASEARLTSLLAGGASIETAAKRLGIAVNTARNQIKSVFEKTDTHSQGQLICLVSQLIPAHEIVKFH